MKNATIGPAICGLVLLLGAAAGCGPPPLANTQSSAEALCRELLIAFQANDVGRLRGLALSEDEFKNHVWPGLPAARPERNLPFDYVWGDLRQKSEGRLTTRLAEHRSRQYQFEAVRFTGGITQYPGFVVHRNVLITVREGSVRHELRLFGSALEQDRRWKVFSFAVDD